MIIDKLRLINYWLYYRRKIHDKKSMFTRCQLIRLHVTRCQLPVFWLCINSPSINRYKKVEVSEQKAFQINDNHGTVYHYI
jgi:hypothetical protein